MEENSVEFVLVLCHDVFLEVIHWGNRRQLIKLERVGQRFHWNIERFFSKTPFLRLDLLLAPRFYVFLPFSPIFLFFSQTEHGLEVKVAKNVENINEYFDFSDLPLDKLAEFPLFLRFNLIKLVCSYSDHKDGKAWDTQPIAAKCQFFEAHLQLIKQEILNDSIFFFGGHVDKNDSSRFSDHSDFLNYFRNRILPISHKPRGYHIFICLYSDNGAAKCVLSSLLQMQEIDCSSEMQIYIHDTDQKRLPIAEISYWLHRKPAEQRKRSLTLVFPKIESIVGIEEMLIHLKVVLSILFEYIILFALNYEFSQIVFV